MPSIEEMPPEEVHDERPLSPPHCMCGRCKEWNGKEWVCRICEMRKAKQ